VSWRDHPIVEEPPSSSGGWRDHPIISQEETDAEAETRLLLEYARRRIAGSPVPNLVAAGANLAAGIAGPVQRLAGFRRKAASTARIAKAFEQAAEEEAGRPGKVLPPIIARGMRGTLATLPPQVIAGVMGGPAGAIGLAAMQEGNQAIFEGREAGLSGVELARYATTQATVEVVPAMVMQRLGLGGFEGIFGKTANRAVTRGVISGLRKAGIHTIAELGEENFTELGHDIAGVVADVDPGDIVDWDRIGNTAANTTVQTLMQMGVASAPGVVQAGLSREGQPEMAPAESGAVPEQAQETEDAQEPIIAEAIQEEPVVAEAVPEEDTVSLTKAAGKRIREDLDLPELPGTGTETHQSVMNEVAEKKTYEGAHGLALDLIAKPRQTTAHEHASLLVAVDKVLTERTDIKAEMAAAAQSGNARAYSSYVRRDAETLQQLDDLTRAGDLAGTEVGRALNIRKLVLKRESFDVASIMQEMQSVKEPGARLTGEEQQAADDFANRYAKALEGMAEVEETIQAEEAAKEEELARKVFATNKPKRQLGRKMREKAISERENIKKRIRQLGVRVHDVSGVSVEGTYLIGRLGLTYVKEGAGTLVEVVERLQADMPDLKLTPQEVYRALIQRSPKSKARARSEANKRISKLTSLARIEVELEDMANGIAAKVKKREPVDAEVKAMRKKLTKARNAYYYLEVEAEKKERALEKINRLQDQLKNGLTQVKEDPESMPADLISLQEKIRELNTEIRVDKQIAELKEQKQTGNYSEPVVKEKKSVDPRLERKQIELAKLRKEKQQLIANAAPWTKERIADEAIATAKALKGTGDVSFTFRQNVGQVLPHPIETSKHFFRALETLTSEDAADKITNEIANAENAFHYARSGLAILDADSPSAQQRHEVFTGTVAERIPVLGKVVKASGRHAVAIGNLVRTSAFDNYLHGMPNATLEEMKALADVCNSTTGIGSVKFAGSAIKWLVRGFFSPKFTASRIQTPFKILQYWKLPRVRKLIAGEMVRAMGTAGTILGLASFAGAQVEWFDVDDPDWMKIRVGNTRIDILGGFQQPARMIARIGSGAFKRDVHFSPLEILGRFAAFKFSPAITYPTELLRRKTAVGEEITPLESTVRLVVPFVLEDIEDAWKVDGQSAAAFITPLVLTGVGASTYRDSETATRRKYRKLWRAGRITEAKQLKREWNRENPDNRIVSVKVD
jgi:hypothetical protein